MIAPFAVRISARGFLCALLAVAAIGTAAAQEGVGSLSLDGRAATESRARLDPLAGLELTARDASGEQLAFAVRFTDVRFPRVGEASLGGAVDGGVHFLQRRGEQWIDLVGTIDVQAFSGQRVAARVDWRADDGDHRLQFDLAPELVLRPLPPIEGCPRVEAPPPVDDRAVDEDLVFCAVGGTGTGLPGAARVIDSIQKLAPTGPLDLVLALGNNLSVHGVQSMGDPTWQSCFESIWNRDRVPCPFFVVPGAWDRRGRVGAMIDYGVMNDRWTMPSTWSYTFTRYSHGKSLDFISLDTDAITGSMGVSTNRHAVRVAKWLIEQSKADWKIVFGHDAKESASLEKKLERLTEFERRVAPSMEKAGVDLYLSAAERFLEVRRPRAGTTHVVCGGGGGAEVAQPMRCDAETVFAHNAGGFAWFRFDGERLRLTMRGVDGAVLFVQDLSK